MAVDSTAAVAAVTTPVVTATADATKEPVKTVDTVGTVPPKIAAPETAKKLDVMA